MRKRTADDGGRQDFRVTSIGKFSADKAGSPAGSSTCISASATASAGVTVVTSGGAEVAGVATLFCTAAEFSVLMVLSTAASTAGLTFKSAAAVAAVMPLALVGLLLLPPQADKRIDKVRQESFVLICTAHSTLLLGLILKVALPAYDTHSLVGPFGRKVVISYGERLPVTTVNLRLLEAIRIDTTLAARNRNLPVDSGPLLEQDVGIGFNLLSKNRDRNMTRGAFNFDSKLRG